MDNREKAQKLEILLPLLNNAAIVRLKMDRFRDALVAARSVRSHTSTHPSKPSPFKVSDDLDDPGHAAAVQACGGSQWVGPICGGLVLTWCGGVWCGADVSAGGGAEEEQGRAGHAPAA